MGAEEVLRDEVRTVKVPGEKNHGGERFVYVKLRWRCPVCGGPRGVPYEALSYDPSGSMLQVHRWDNPCGHIDSYGADGSVRGCSRSGSFKSVVRRQAVKVTNRGSWNENPDLVDKTIWTITLGPYNRKASTNRSAEPGQQNQPPLPLNEAKIPEEDHLGREL